MGGFLGGIFGSRTNKFDTVTSNRLTPDQQSYWNKLMQGSQQGTNSGLQYLSKLASGDESVFDEMEAPALRQFGTLQGQLASRFSQGGGGYGAMSSRHGSGFKNASGSLAMELSENLASKRAEYRSQAIRELLGLSNTLLNPTQETAVAPKRPSIFESLLQAIAPAAGAAAGGYFGGKI